MQDLDASLHAAAVHAVKMDAMLVKLRVCTNEMGRGELDYDSYNSNEGERRDVGTKHTPP